jgi:hypothetical protein
MKPLVTVIAFALWTSTLLARPVNLPLDSRLLTLITAEHSGFPACRADITINGKTGKIVATSINIADQEYAIAADALDVLPVPDLSSLGIQAEKGRDGRLWISIVLVPAPRSEHETRFHISIIDGTFTQISKSWDESQGDSTRRHFEILYKTE